MWTVGEGYERYMAGWSRLVARRFLPWLDAPPGLRWLDVGCGTGALTAEVVRRCRPADVLGVDRSAAFVVAAAPGASYLVADAGSLPVRGASRDVVVSGLFLNFPPVPEAVLAELVRVVRPGGIVAGYVWDYGSGMRLLRHFWDAAALADPAAAALDEARRFPLCHPARLRALWAGVGLVDVACEALTVRRVFASFAEVWEPFHTGQGPAPGYVVSLDPDRRERLRLALRDRLPAGPDGSIRLAAGAWAVRGRRR